MAVGFDITKRPKTGRNTAWHSIQAAAAAAVQRKTKGDFAGLQ